MAWGLVSAAFPLVGWFSWVWWLIIRIIIVFQVILIKIFINIRVIIINPFRVNRGGIIGILWATSSSIIPSTTSSSSSSCLTWTGWNNSLHSRVFKGFCQLPEPILDNSLIGRWQWVLLLLSGLLCYLVLLLGVSTTCLAAVVVV